MITLKEDIKSMFHKDRKEKIYGKRNEAVTIISDRGDVLIVKGKTGEVFPVNKQNLIFS